MRVFAIQFIAFAVAAVAAFQETSHSSHDQRRNDSNCKLRIVDFKSYPRYDEIRKYLKTIAQCNRFVEYRVLGHSFENREIMGLKLSIGSGIKPAVFIDAGFHAREWIAPTTALYAIKQLVENFNNHQLFKNVDIYIVPLVNPDGYEFTHKSDRYWRKNRSTNKNPFTTCRGTDLNRNFELEWGSFGASKDPCHPTYPGTRSFSEPESRAIRDFILDRRERIKVYLTLHSFGQYFLHPWGFTKELPENVQTLKCTANAALAELKKVRGTTYQVGSSTNLLKLASGGSDDWAMGTAKIPIVFTIELPPKGPIKETSFDLPVSEIEPVGRETFEAFKVFFRYANGELCHESKPTSAPSKPQSSSNYEKDGPYIFSD